MGKEGASNLVSLLSKSLEPVVDMHNNDRVICSCDPTWQWGVMARTRILDMYALWPCHKRYDLGLKSWHTIGSWKTIVWNIIQIQLGSDELWPGHGFWVCVQCDLDDTHLWVMDNCLCEILFRSDKWVRSYDPDTMWTDGQTGWFLYIPKLCLWGYN